MDKQPDEFRQSALCAYMAEIVIERAKAGEPIESMNVRDIAGQAMGQILDLALELRDNAEMRYEIMTRVYNTLRG